MFRIRNIPGVSCCRGTAETRGLSGPDLAGIVSEQEEGGRVRFGDVCEGRDNNLNLIRMIAASAVLVSHAWPIGRGAGTREPLRDLLGHSLGTVSVFVFFAVSGFLIARSFERQPGVGAWARARALRLFPGLAVALVLTVVLLGPLATVLPLRAYLTDPATLTYLPRNLSLAFLQYDLPGVFGSNPFPAAINGSLWTLFHEVLCYAGILVIGLLGAFRSPGRLALAGLAFVLGWIAVSLAPPELVPHSLGRFFHLAPAFAVGTAFYALRRRLVLHPLGLAALVGAAVLLRDTVLYQPAFLLALAYGVFLLGYGLRTGPARRLQAYNRLGDYSYGTYIYAFPVQQLWAWGLGPMHPLLNVALALPVTLALAVASWHFVEGPALALARGRRPSGPVASRAG